MPMQMSISPPRHRSALLLKTVDDNEPTRKSRKGDKDGNTKAERLEETSGNGDPEGGLL